MKTFKVGDRVQARVYTSTQPCGAWHKGTITSELKKSFKDNPAHEVKFDSGVLYYTGAYKSADPYIYQLDVETSDLELI